MDYSRSQSGLILAHESVDGATLERALKRLDRDLALQAWPQLNAPPLWKVVRYAGPDRPPETIFSWVDSSGYPLPLSWSLVEQVQRLDRNSPVPHVTVDEKNEQFKQRLDADWDTDVEAITDNWRFKHGRPVLPRSQALRRSRDKRRAKGENV